MQTSQRIGIDCRLAGSQHAGIGRYVENLLRELLNIASPQIKWVLFFSDQQQASDVLTKPPANVEVIFAPIRHYSLQEQLKMPAIFKAANLDLLHVPHFNVPLLYHQPTVVTIHDLLWHEQRGSAVTTLSPLMYWLKYAFYHLVVNHAVAVAKTIFVPAQTIRETVLKYYPSAISKVVVTYEGVATKFTKTPSLPQHSKHLYEIIYTGSLYPHKNIEVVLQMLAQHPEVHLTLVGARNVFLEKIRLRTKELKITDQVTFAGFIPDDELTKLYQKADALVQPSLSEGFGLTGLEALATGLPVIVSDIPIFREIYEDSALYFDPHTSQQVWNALTKVRSRKNALLQAAKNLLQRYNWREMAHTTFAHYQKILASA